MEYASSEFFFCKFKLIFFFNSPGIVIGVHAAIFGSRNLLYAHNVIHLIINLQFSEKRETALPTEFGCLDLIPETKQQTQKSPAIVPLS